MTAEPDLLAEVRDWIAQDPDPRTRDELQRLLDEADAAQPDARRELQRMFAGRLAFGTAGLRAELGPGPVRMNRVVVARAAAGFAAFLVGRDPHPSIVIGYDARESSDVFARDTAELMAGAGVRALLFDHAVPTPVLAAAIRDLDVGAGVMVTASHNPPRDNGYKVYLGGADAGSQIVPPVDADIEAAIAAVGDIRELLRSDEWERVPDAVLARYVEATAGIVPAPAAQPRVVYTAMHGVGWPTVRRVLAAAGFDEPAVVPEQIEPDAAFPTVAFPNPEEPGALDLAMRTAREHDADLLLANDPDADRLAVAVPDPDADGGWRRLTGNELGTLLGWRAASAPGARGVLAASLVSSPALAAIAERYGLPYVETLTGFKWISRVPDLLFGYEEALGYLVDPRIVRDKDGISAALALLDLAASLHSEGRTLDDLGRDIATEIGAHASAQVSVRVADLAEIPRLTASLRADPPTSIGGVAVEGVDDFALGASGFPPSDILRYRLAGGGRVIVRPSGTEPKLKVYLDTVSHEGDSVARQAAAARQRDALEAGVRELLASA